MMSQGVHSRTLSIRSSTCHDRHCDPLAALSRDGEATRPGLSKLVGPAFGELPGSCPVGLAAAEYLGSHEAALEVGVCRASGQAGENPRQPLRWQGLLAVRFDKGSI